MKTDLPKNELTNEKIEALVKRIAKDGYYSDNNTNQDWYPERLLELRTLIHQAEITEYRKGYIDGFKQAKMGGGSLYPLEKEIV